MIIDTESCSNVSSIILIKKLNPNIVKHYRSYLKICMKVVSKTCLSKIIIGNYFHTVSMKAKVGKKKSFEGLNKTN
jgi:hypothetical protein